MGIVILVTRRSAVFINSNNLFGDNLMIRRLLVVFQVLSLLSLEDIILSSEEKNLFISHC